MKKENDNIIRLIVKRLRGELTPEEEFLFLAWRGRSDDNDHMYKRLENECGKSFGYSLFKKFYFRREWSVVSRGIHRRRIMRRVRRMAVAASLIFFVLASCLIFFWERENTIEMASIKSIDDYSFSKKARLILAGGDTLQINPVKSDTLVKCLPFVENNGNTLIYHATRSTDSLVYNTLDIPRGGAYSLQLADGTRIMLNSDSRLRFPQAFLGNSREVYLDGEAYFQVAKNIQKPFVVHCKHHDVRVLGTTFNVSAYRDDEVAQTTLVEGWVNITCGDTTVSLVPGMMATVFRSHVSTRGVDVDSYISWTKDQFSFSEERLEDLLKKISRWYDVDFVYADVEVKEFKFSGFIPRYESIVSLFEILEQSSGVKFIQKNKKIYISEN